MAATLALGGHALVLFGVLLWATHHPSIAVAPTVVGVTLVNGGPGGAAAGPDRPTPPLAPRAAPAAVSDANHAPSGEALDRLIDAPAAPPPTFDQARVSAGGAQSASSAERAAGRSGSSRADQGLGQGEGVERVDLYAAASLPSVGLRPQAPPSGDLWRQVAPCWRTAAPRPVTLLVLLKADGQLADAPQAVRRRGIAADPQTLLAERAAVRALQACAPYAGLDGKAWRVEFP